VARRYEPSPKHKYPKGFGSLCPRELEIEEAQTLLEAAIVVAGAGENKLWAASGRWCFCAHPTRLEDDVWHGFPVVGGDVPEPVFAALAETGQITRAERKRPRKQRELPAEWP
jgi:hypothetical protein